METDKRDKTPVIWRTLHEKRKTKWKIGFVLMNFIYLTVIVSMGLLFIQHEKVTAALLLQKEELDTLKTKENIYTILRNKGVSLSQGLDIAEVTIRQ